MSSSILKMKASTGHNEQRVFIENLYDFTNLIAFNFTAQIKADGEILKTVELNDLEVEKHTGKLIRISLSGIDVLPNTRYFVQLSATLKNDWGLLPKRFRSSS